MLVFGGIHINDGSYNDVHFLRTSNLLRMSWYQPQSISGEPPSPRFAHGAGRINDFTVAIFAGASHNILGDMHILSLAIANSGNNEGQQQKAVCLHAAGTTKQC